jgi:RHS repeat-associated protein
LLPDAALTLTRDLEGEITAVTEGTNHFAYSYDTAGQLADAALNGTAIENYSYDANGNRTTSHLHASYVTGTGNRLLQAGAWALSYDHEGNLITKSNTANGDVFLFTWDHRNRLTQVLKTNSVNPGVAGLTDYRYDGFNRRIAVIRGGVTNWTYYDGDQPIADYAGTETTPIRVFAAGEKLDELYSIWNRTQTNFWLLTDQIGSIRRVIARDGFEVAALSYDGFGRPMSATGAQPAVAGRFGFAGREWDSDTGLYYNRARYYDPELGRFISADPIGFDGGDFNLYRYAANRPVSATDPLGTVTAVEYAVLDAAAKLGDITAYCTLAFGVLELYQHIVSNVVPALQGRPQPYNPTDANGNGVPDAIEGVAPGPGAISPFYDIPQCAKSVSGGLP